MKMRNMAGAFVVFYLIVILTTTAFTGFKEGYDIQEQELENNLNVFERLQQINIIKGLNELTIGIQRVAKLNNPADLLGGLAVSASGTLQLIGGIVTFPFDIAGAISNYYGGNYIPDVMVKIIGFFAVIAVGFVLLSAKLGFEI